ncbi:MAG: hypothetical protein ABH803_01305 [Candidatus Micrarchaeota archaeon]
MDFTLLFLVILMLLAVQSQLTGVAILLGIVLLVKSTNNKYNIAAALVGILIVLGAMFFDLGGEFWLIAGGLFAIIILLVKGEPDPAQGYGR